MEIGFQSIMKYLHKFNVNSLIPKIECYDDIFVDTYLIICYGN